MEQRSDSLDGFGRGIYVHTFEFAGFDPAAGLRRFLGFRRLLFLLSSLFVDGVIVRPHGLPLRVDFGNLAGGRDSGIDRCFALLREFRLLAEEDHAECRAFHHAAWVGSVKRMQHRDYWTQNNVIQRIDRKS